MTFWLRQQPEQIWAEDPSPSDSCGKGKPFTASVRNLGDSPLPVGKGKPFTASVRNLGDSLPPAGKGKPFTASVRNLGDSPLPTDRGKPHSCHFSRADAREK